MKKISLIVFVIFITAIAFSQNNVGIGTSTPNSLLHIRSGSTGVLPYNLANLTIEGITHTYLQILTPSNKEGGIMFGNTNGATQGGIYYNNPANPEGLEFRTNGNISRMVIDNTGNMGIGVADPTAKLDINGGLRIRGNSPKAGALLVADGNAGNTTWMQPSAFRAEGLYDLVNVNTSVNSTSFKLLFNSIATYNIGLTYAVGVSEFTAPVKGVYHISLQTMVYTQDDKTNASPFLFTQSNIELKRKRGISNISLAESTQSNGVSGDNTNVSSSVSLAINQDFVLEAGDIIWAELYQPRKGYVYGEATKTSFSGHLVTRLF